MNSYLLILFSGYTIGLAAVVGFIRYRSITSEDRPFFYIVWAALLAEILNEIFTILFRSTAVSSNIYVLAEALLYIWLFYNWGSLRWNKKKLNVLITFICLIWIADNLIIHPLNNTNALFRMVYSFILVLLAIDQINQIITTERSNLLKNARFLISVGVVIFFTYKAIIEVFFVLDLPLSNTFYAKVYIIMDYVNLFVNLIFGLAAIWIPTRQKFILPF